MVGVWKNIYFFQTFHSWTLEMYVYFSSNIKSKRKTCPNLKISYPLINGIHYCKLYIFFLERISFITNYGLPTYYAKNIIHDIKYQPQRLATGTVYILYYHASITIDSFEWVTSSSPPPWYNIMMHIVSYRII